MSPTEVAISRVCREHAEPSRRSGLEVLEDVATYYNQRQDDAWKAMHVNGNLVEQKEILLEIGGIIASLPEILTHEQVDCSDIPTPYLNMVDNDAERAKNLCESQNLEGLKILLGPNRFIFPNDPNYLTRYIIEPLRGVSK
ncbi:hypothetical protein M1349_01520 [Patescibacteria group bacterium]|nr:hypothetical protein [Patescibacteria group bacterium]